MATERISHTNDTEGTIGERIGTHDISDR